MRRRRRGALALALLLAALGGCGYGFRGTMPEDVRTVAVPIFTNRTQEPGVESVLTRAVVDAFATNGRLRLVSREDADAVLEGEVTEYTILAIAFDETLNVQQYRLIVSMNLRLRDVRNNAVLFQQANFREQADFRVVGPVSQTISREAGALRLAAAEIGRSVVSLAVDRF